MLKSVESANGLLLDLQDNAAKTPFELPELVTGTKRLIAFGIAQEDVIDRMNRLGDLTQGQADGLNRLTLAYGKLKAKGKASLEELNMFTEAGVPLMDELARQFNVTTNELFDMVSKGKVGFADVEQAIISLTSSGGQFYQMMQKQSQTLTGKKSTLQDDLTNISRTIGNEMLPATKELIDDLDELAISVNKNIQAFINWTKTNNELIGSINDTGTILGILKMIGNAASSALLGIPLFHSGGVVPGTGEMLTILKGGETVRTQGQELDVQKKLNGESTGSTVVYAPTFKSLDPVENMKMARQDERRIIDLVTDAVKRNRFGLRTVVRSV